MIGTINIVLGVFAGIVLTMTIGHKVADAFDRIEGSNDKVIYSLVFFVVLFILFLIAFLFVSLCLI